VWAQDCCWAQNQGRKLNNQLQNVKDFFIHLAFMFDLIFCCSQWQGAKRKRERGALRITQAINECA
jgi:hypothetical protein